MEKILNTFLGKVYVITTLIESCSDKEYEHRMRAVFLDSDDKLICFGDEREINAFLKAKDINDLHKCYSLDDAIVGNSLEELLAKYKLATCDIWDDWKTMTIEDMKERTPHINKIGDNYFMARLYKGMGGC